MSSTNITEVVDKLVSEMFKYVNVKGSDDIVETIDRLRQGISLFENEEDAITEMIHIDFGDYNRVRDFFLKNYTRLKSAKLTKEWMYDFLYSIKSIDNISERGIFKKYSDISDELIPLYIDRLHDIQPERTVGGGEYLMMMILSLVGEVCKPDVTNGISGDLLFNGEVYEVKGDSGRLDGADDNKLLDVLGKYYFYDGDKPMNNGRSTTVWASKNEDLVKDMLRCYFDGNNPYPIIAVNKTSGGYVIIDQNLKWQGADIGLIIPKWMKEQAFGGHRVLNFNHNEFNHNDRTIKLKMKRIGEPVKKTRKRKKKK